MHQNGGPQFQVRQLHIFAAIEEPVFSSGCYLPTTDSCQLEAFPLADTDNVSYLVRKDSVIFVD
jgi:hypothetical protein